MKARWLFAALVAAPIALTACKREFTPPDPENVSTNGGTNGSTNNMTTSAIGNIGDDCASVEDCSQGLVCDEESETCQAPGDVAEGQPCYRTAECGDELYCEPTTSVCAPAGDSAVGGPCGANGDCEKGLVCAPSGFSGECVEPGENDLGDTCEGYIDCIAGLGCAPDLMDPEGPSTCQPGLAGLPIPWPGVDCAEDEDGNFRVFFEVPDGEVTEFYRLPYPNDIRLSSDGHPVLDGHPTPGEGVLGYDLVQRYIDRIEEVQDGFGLNSWTFMRFSETVDFDTLTGSGDNPTIYVVILDPDHPRYGSTTGLRFRANTARNKYMCQNWMAVKPGGDWGRPMAPNTTYGVVTTTGIRSSGGVPAEPDADFAAMLDTTRPSGALGDAWDAYQPLRDWIADQSIDESTLSAAAVFTTGDPITEAQALTDPARETVPTAGSLTHCDGVNTSPCDYGEDDNGDTVDACTNQSTGDYDEVHGLVSLPVFQSGDAPYFESGGEVTPGVQRREDVCMAMTVPTGTMPTEGWPVLIYAHGTGGGATSHILDGTVANVNEITVDNETVQFLTIGWDQVQHGSRRNGDDTHPNELVFNYGNPDAAKGNFLQGAADVHAMMAYVETIDIPADQSPTGAAIKADPNQIYFMGHSQGGTTGPLALPFDTTSQGTVLSGAGAGLILALLGKTSPVNSPAAVKFVLMETGDVTTAHPVLNLLQAYFDPVDPINFGHLVGAQVIDGVTTPKHVFHPYGMGDTYTPPSGLNAMARALRATYLLPWEDEISGVPTAEVPFSGNVTHDTESYSVLGRQYAPDGYDGHFVIFRNDTATGDLAEFLGTGVVNGLPEIR